MHSVYELYRRGCDLLDHGDYEAAIVPLTRAREIEPTKMSIREALGRALFHAQRYERAAAELQAACEREFPACDVLLMTAAVADFRPTDPVGGKIKKGGRAKLTIEMEPTADVLCGLAARRAPGQTLVGFAAEHGESGLEHARAKLVAKGLDAVVVNDISRTDIGFESDSNEVTILTSGAAQQGAAERVSRAPKESIAAAILDAVQRLRAGA